MPVDKFSAPLIFRMLCAAGLTFGLSTALPAADRKPVTLSKAPPQPVQVTIRVPRGEPVDIPLRIYGTRSQTLEFRIRTLPRSGKLSPVKQVDQEVGRVTYTPPDDLNITADAFTYVVRSKEGVSAASTISINILDIAPKLVAPSSVEFPQTVTGAPVSRELEITNRGGGIAEGELQINEPWKVEGPAGYRLRAGESRSVKIHLNTLTPGEFRGQLRFSSEPERSTSLSARIIAPVTFSANKVELVQSAVTSIRSGSVDLINHTDTETTVTLTANKRLIFPRAVRLAKSGKETLLIQTLHSDTKAFEETISLGDSGSPLVLSVHTNPVGPLLRFQKESIDFGEAKTGLTLKQSVEVENYGGTITAATVHADAPFQVESTFLPLDPGQVKKVNVVFVAREAGAFRGTLNIQTSAATISLPLEAKVQVEKPHIPPAHPTQRVIASAPPPPVENPPPPEANPASAAILLNCKITSLTPHSAEVSWIDGEPGTVNYQAWMRVLSLENSELKVDWIEFPALSTTRKENQITALLTGLEQRNPYAFRMQGIDAAGLPVGPFIEIQFVTPEAKARIEVTPLRILTAALLICIAAIIRQRSICGRKSRQ